MSEDITLAVLLSFFFFGMTAFALLINSILLRFVKTLGTKNQPGAIVRWSAETKPAIGGLAFFIIFLISLCIYSISLDPTEVFKSTTILGLLIAATLGFLLGLTDDAYNTRPVLKFTVQVLCGIILLLTDSRIAVFENDFMNSIMTVVWVVGIMNSINMLDNMDGIATSVTGFIIIAGLGYIGINGDWLNVNFLILLGVLAALVGFLFYNWNPSSIYMGDTGSQFLGVVLGYIGIHYCWNGAPLNGDGGELWGLAALLLVFVLPIADTTVVTINRLRNGKSPFVGGRDHTTHNLSYLGLTDRQVATIFCIIGACASFLYLYMISAGQNLPFALIFIAYFLAVFLLLFFITEYNRKKESRTEPSKSAAVN